MVQLRVVARALGAGALLVLVGSAAACSPEVQTTSESACVAPMVSVEPTAVSPGDEVTVRGEAMIDGCADAISVDEHGNQTPNEIETPLTGLEVVLRTGDMERVLATVDSDAHGKFEVMVVVPRDAPIGASEISVGPVWVEPARLEVVG